MLISAWSELPATLAMKKGDSSPMQEEVHSLKSSDEIEKAHPRILDKFQIPESSILLDKNIL